MLSKITSIFIIALWMHNTAVWGFVFPGMSAIRHQSLVCQGCGSPVDKEEAQSTLGKLSARILFRHNPVFYVIQQISEGLCRKRSGLWTISAGLVESKALHSSHRGYSVQHSLPLLTPPINAKGRFRDTASIVEVKKKYSIYYIFLLKACKLLLSIGRTRRQDLASLKWKRPQLLITPLTSDTPVIAVSQWGTSSKCSIQGLISSLLFSKIATTWVGAVLMCAHNSLGEREVEEARQGSWVPALCLAERYSTALRDSRRGFTAPALQELYRCCQGQMCHTEEGECKGDFWMGIHPSEPQ